MGDALSEFVFVFNDRLRADAGAEAARALGYDARLLPGDGEGHHVQLRLRRRGIVGQVEFDRAVEHLRRVLAQHRGRFVGGARLS